MRSVSKTKVIFFPRYAPTDIGHGGDHRTYQIWHDLCRLVGEENTNCFYIDPKIYRSLRNNSKELKSRQFKRLIQFIGTYISSFGNSSRIYKYIFSKGIKSKNLFGYFPLEGYKQLISSLDQNIICVIDHPRQHGVVDFNRDNNIPTFYCPQNVESFEILAGSFNSVIQTSEFLLRFSQEFDLISNCAERFCISKVETGLLGGLGFPSTYYPYIPVGLIRSRLKEIERNRRNNRFQTNHFLLLGSYIHQSTQISFDWFINQIINEELPEGIQITIAGSGTEKIQQKIKNLPKNVKILGWVSQEDLNAILCNISAAIIPQRLGFGALTRLSELSCASIPTIVSEHALTAINIPPGVYPVRDSWDDWLTTIREFSECSPNVNEKEYCEWEKNQPRGFESRIIHWLS